VEALKVVLWTILLVVPNVILASDVDASCGTRPANSEYCRNPPEQFVTPRLSRFYRLEQDIASAYTSGNDDEVKSLSAEYLNLALTYRCNWNYGNAIHDANRYLGLISLRNRNVKEAATFLRLSGKTPGSPQLNTLGPDLDLADQLLRDGEIDAVTQYLTDIKTFWKGDKGGVDRWLTAIKRGERPKLDRFSASTRSPWAQYVGWVWPELIVLSFLYGARNRLPRKLVFVIAGSATVYATSYLVLHLMNWAFTSVIAETTFEKESLLQHPLLLSFSIILLWTAILAMVLFTLAMFWIRPGIWRLITRKAIVHPHSSPN
jgi:hypothetical protein